MSEKVLSKFSFPIMNGECSISVIEITDITDQGEYKHFVLKTIISNYNDINAFYENINSIKFLDVKDIKHIMLQLNYLHFYEKRVSEV